MSILSYLPLSRDLSSSSAFALSGIAANFSVSSFTCEASMASSTRAIKGFAVTGSKASDVSFFLRSSSSADFFVPRPTRSCSAWFFWTSSFASLTFRRYLPLVFLSSSDAWIYFASLSSSSLLRAVRSAHSSMIFFSFSWALFISSTVANTVPL